MSGSRGDAEPFDDADSAVDGGAFDGATAWMIGEIGVDETSRTRHDLLRADEREALEIWRDAFIGPDKPDLEALVRKAHSIRAALRPIQLGGSEIIEAGDGGDRPPVP